MHSELKKFLFRKPQPTKVRVTLEDGEQRTIAIASDKRGGWAECEQTINALDPVAIEALAFDDTLLRAANLRDAPEAEEKGSKKSDGALDKIIDRYGHRLNEAFHAGAQAASVSQDKLVGLVETLTTHLTAAIENTAHLGAKLGAVASTVAEDPMQMMAMNLLSANTNPTGGVQMTQQQAAMLIGQLSPQQAAMFQAALASRTNGNGKP